MRQIILIICLLMPANLSMAQQNDGGLQNAFVQMAKGDWDGAQAKAGDEIGQGIIEWHRLRAGHGSFADYHSFLDKNPDWPGLPLLRKKGEAAIDDETPDQEIIHYFEPQKPRSGHGAYKLAAAYENTGKPGYAAAEIVRAWRQLRLNKSGHEMLLGTHKDLLAPHHTARLDMLLWAGRHTDARRMFDLVDEGWIALAQARIALRQDAGDVDALIKAVPKTLQNHPGLAYERFVWRAKKGRREDAISLLLERSTSAEKLGEPLRWANRRRSLARQIMRTGDGALAYRIASSHQLGQGSHFADLAHFADLEWLSGYLALRYLNDAKTALAHFKTFRVAVRTPISLGRAGYWEGRAYEALGNAESAQAAYAFGAEHQTGFYGLLAAERGGFPMDTALTGSEVFADWRTAEFMSSSVLRAALMLHRANQPALSRRFFLQVAENLDRAELGQLADLTLFLKEPHFALMIAKQGAKRGLVLPAASFPLHDLIHEELPVAPELALAIARRESEFNPVVISGAGAKGLMQLMPKTAESVAAELGLEFDLDRLLSDWRFNARLGVRYLAYLQEEFGMAPILVSVGYNAGPSRARAWIEAFGDPREPGVDLVDWIEHIPFRETRNYVMRVTESLPIYRARLSGKTPPISLLQELRRGH